MEEDDLEELETAIDGLGERLGASDQIGETEYRHRPAMDSEEKPLEQQDRIVEKLRTLDRILALRDVNTYLASMNQMELVASINELGWEPKRAVIVEPTTGDQVYGFLDLPDLSASRKVIHDILSRMDRFNG